MPKDNREIHSAIRMPGQGSGDNWQRTSRGPMAFNKGALVTDVDELQKLAEAKKVDLQALYNRGVISGDWKGVKKAKG